MATAGTVIDSRPGILIGLSRHYSIGGVGSGCASTFRLRAEEIPRDNQHKRRQEDVKAIGQFQ